MNHFKRRAVALVAAAATSLFLLIGLPSSVSADPLDDSAEDAVFQPVSEDDFEAQGCSWNITTPRFDGYHTIWAQGTTQGCSKSSYYKFQLVIERHRWYGWDNWTSKYEWSGDRTRMAAKSCAGSGNHNYKTTIKGYRTGHYPTSFSSSTRRYTC